MTENRRIEGIYGILPGGLETDAMLTMARAALAGGVRTLQLRDKGRGFKDSLKRAKALHTITRDFGARLIVNDSLQLAQDSGAEGVHLGRSDMQSVATIRSEVGREPIIGISCQADAAFARHVLDEGADYVSFGAIFATDSKPEAAPIGLPRLAKARHMFPVANICAIGGIDEEALPAVRKTGADCAAVIASLFATGDVEARARNMVRIWNDSASA